MHAPGNFNPASAIGGTRSVQPFNSTQPSSAPNDLGPMRPASNESRNAIQQFNQAIHAQTTAPCALPQNFTYGNIHALLQANQGAMIAFVNDRNEITDMFRLGPDGNLIHTTPCGMNDATERTIGDLNSVDSRLAALRGRQDSAIAMNAGPDALLDDFEPVAYKKMFNSSPQPTASTMQQQNFGAASSHDSRYPSQSMQPRSAVVHPIHNGRQTAAQIAAENQAQIERQIAMDRRAALQQKAFVPYCNTQNYMHNFCKDALTNSSLADKLSVSKLGLESTDWSQVMQAYDITALSGGHAIKDNTRVAIQNASRGDLEKYRSNLNENLKALQEKIEDIRSGHSKDYLQKGKVPPQNEVHTANMLSEWHNQLAALGRDIDVQLAQKVEKPSLLDRFLAFFS